MTVTDHVVLEKDGEIARVWLNRPHKKNAVTVELLHRLDEIIREVDSDPDLRVLVLRGREGTFCSGFDLDELLADYVGTTTAMEVAVLSAKVCDRLYSMNTPSVAVLEGFVTAGGFELMISCDFAVVGRRRPDRRLPHPPRALRRRRPDLPAAADDRHPQDQGADAHRQAAVGQGGGRLRPDQRLRARPRSSTSWSRTSSPRSSTRARSRCG